MIISMINKYFSSAKSNRRKINNVIQEYFFLSTLTRSKYSTTSACALSPS